MTREELKKLKKDCEDDGLTVRQYFYTGALEDEVKGLTKALEKAAKTLDNDNCCPDSAVYEQCDGIIDNDRANCQQCWLDWLRGAK